MFGMFGGTHGFIDFVGECKRQVLFDLIHDINSGTFFPFNQFFFSKCQVKSVKCLSLTDYKHEIFQVRSLYKSGEFFVQTMLCTGDIRKSLRRSMDKKEQWR